MARIELSVLFVNLLFLFIFYAYIEFLSFFCIICLTNNFKKL